MRICTRLLSLALIIFCASCDEKEDMLNNIQSAGVVIVEFTNMKDLSTLASPKAQCYCVSSEEVTIEISKTLSSNHEQLHSTLSSSTLPFGFISIYDLVGERLLVFKLNRELSDKIKNIVSNENKRDAKEIDLFLTQFSSEKFTVHPKKYPLAMSYKITQKQFEQAVGAYRENAR